MNITTGGAATMTIEERVEPAAEFSPEIASLNMGSMNFGLFPMLDRYRTFKHDWERPYLEGSRDRVFKNTFSDIEYILTTCAGNGTRFEIECYDIGHLYTLRTSPIGASSSRRSSSSRCSASSAGSGRIPRTWPT